MGKQITHTHIYEILVSKTGHICRFTADHTLKRCTSTHFICAQHTNFSRDKSLRYSMSAAPYDFLYEGINFAFLNNMHTKFKVFRLKVRDIGEFKVEVLLLWPTAVY